MIEDEIVISSLLTEPTISKAAEKCGLSQRQIFERLKKPQFKEKYSQTKRQILESTVNTLQRHLTSAAETAVNIMQDEETAPQTRLNACNLIFNQCQKLTETIDLLDRITILEERLGVNE